jgi:RHS repeat-associated protein
LADQLGSIPYQSYHGGDIDSVNLSNGRVSVHVPLISYPQRGGLLKENFSLVNGSNALQVQEICTPPPDVSCLYEWDAGSSKSQAGAGVSATVFAVDDQAPGAGVVQVKGNVLPGGTQNYYYYGRLFGSDGTSHLVGQTSGVWETTNTSLTNAAFRAIDGTGYSFAVDGSGNWTTTDAAGVKYYQGGASGVPTVWKEDPNGNQVTRATGGIIDTMGRNIPSIPNTTSPPSDSSSCPQGGTLLPINFATVWTLPGLNGGSFQVKFCYALVTVNIPPLTIDTEQVNQYPGNPHGVNTLQSVVFLANNTAWSFEYNDVDGTSYKNLPVNYGSLTKITLPTGGTISYTYSTLTGGHDIGSRWAASRIVNANDGTGNHTWTYAYNPNSPITTTVTDPLLNDTVHTFTLAGSGTEFETSTQFFLGPKANNAVLKTVATQYNYIIDYGAGDAAAAFPTSITTTWPNGQASQVTKTYDGGFSFYNAAQNSTGPYGKVISEAESDYTTNGTYPKLRSTATSYMFQNSSNYLNNNMLNLVSSVQVSDGNANQLSYATYNYDENTPSSSGITTQHDSNPPGGSYRGNRTSVHMWLNSGTFTCPGGGSGGSGGYLISKTTFFDTGMVNAASDPCANSTSYLYSSTYAGAFPTTVTNALQQQTTNVYDFNTGLKTSTTDPNQLTTSYTFDSMWRLYQANHPDNALDTITRQESTYPFTATLTSTINTGQNTIPLTVFDGLGRTSQTQHTSDPQGIVYIDNTYDALGRVASVSNPYRTGTDATSSPGTTTYSYDPLGRKTLETLPDGSTITTAYCGANTLVTDPTGKWRRSRVDGLGHLVEVDEPNSATATVLSTGCTGTNEPIWVTSYTVDALGNLKQVVQNGSHTRTFTYDSLSRLLTSSNPEVGSITYTYNPDGTVLTKKDARAITATYAYDKLHRETGVTYSNGDPALIFTYDGTNCLSLTACQNIGHRTGMTDGGGSEAWAYQVDKANNRSIHREQRATNSSPSNITKTTTYYLDLAGNVTQIVYPTGRTINYSYDSANRPSNATDASNGITYATGWKTPPGSTNCTASAVCYTPQGSIYALSIGQTTSFTGFNTLETFTNRLQPSEIKASSTAGTAIDITYNFALSTSHNAGHVYQITNNLNSSRTQTYTYDQLNRISSAGTSSTTGTYCWGFQYSYDAWGNLLSQAGWSPTYNSCTEATMGFVTADAYNHISGLTYDASGNTQSDGSYTYTWDGESQLKSAAGVTYAYDGDGRRVAKVGSKLYWYGSGGEILSETDAAGNTQNEYIFFGGKRVAMVPAAGGALYYAEDLLGSARVIVQSNGTLCYDADFTPFGGERAYTTTCAQNYKFEGKERDTETQNDDFGARYYSSRLGRWLSSDWSAVPVPVPYANLTNPQTLNLYAMVADDPESFADLDGHGDATAAPNGGLTPGGQADDCAHDQQKCGAQQQNQTSQNQNAQAQNPVVQVVQDTVVGGAKEVANTVIDAANTVNKPIDALLSNFTSFQFGQMSEYQGSTSGEKSAMAGVFIASFFTGAGEEKAATKIGTITADAEKLYPKLAGKFQEHHIIPQYLGGAKDGATARIPAAYHQLITNEFRALAPYGQKIQRTAEEVGRILQQVYSKYPLP